jgi:DNA-binding transcriptional regulator YdaS (Cro superfamily)
MRDDQVLARLRAECRKAGGQRAWAALYGVSESYVSDLLHGRRKPGPRVLKALGLVVTISYGKLK